MNSTYNPNTITTRLPPIQRSTSPALRDILKEFLPSPVQKQTPSSLPELGPRRSTEPPRPARAPLPRSTSAWERPGRTARSLSPASHSNPPVHVRARTPPNNVSTTAPAPRYNYVSRDFLAPPGGEFDGPVYEQQRGRTNARQLPPTRNAQGRDLNPAGLRPGMTPGPQFELPAGPQPRAAKPSFSDATLVPKPLAPRGGPPSRQPRKHVPSMMDYLSLEQLENLWQSHDMYGGTIGAPQKAPSPIWRAPDFDPRSPVLPIHPALRNEPVSFHNSFA